MTRLSGEIGELSGLVASKRHRGIAWMIRDSGAPASLYAIRLGGHGEPRVHEVRIEGARNEDWEDISYSIGPDGRGRLWIVESTQSRSDPYIYEVVEPEPFGPRSVRLHQRYRYSYPKEGMENTEASFMWSGRLVLVTKTSPSRLYLFGKLESGTVNRPRYIGKLHGANKVSVARLSPDRRSLVASNHETVRVFRGRGAKLSDFTEGGPVRRRTVARGDNIEAGDFFPSGSCDVVMVSERKNVYRVMAAPR